MHYYDWELPGYFSLGGAVNGTGFRKSTPREVKLEDIAEEYRDTVLHNMEPYHTLRKLRIKPLEVPEWNIQWILRKEWFYLLPALPAFKTKIY